MKTVGAMITGNGSITIQIDGKVHTIATDHRNYKAIIETLKSGVYDKLETLVDIPKTIVTGSKGKVEVKDGQIFFKGKNIQNAVTERILSLIDNDFPFEPMVGFLENVMLNPSETATNELLLFLESNMLPITPDGCFLAYKRVTSDFKDCYTGKFDNSVGKVVKMDRNKVNQNRNETCSHGLHFCSRSYLGDFHSGEGHVVVVKINPKDVVSIPSDYNNAKGRCCEYEVVAVHEQGEKVERFEKPVYNNDASKYVPPVKDTWDIELVDDDEWTDDQPKGTIKVGTKDLGRKPDGKAFYNGRGAGGKFVKRTDKPVKVPKGAYGIKPDGSKFHNVRGANGKFSRKS